MAPVKTCALYCFVLNFFLAFGQEAWIDRAKQLCSLGEMCDPMEGSWMPLPDGVKCGVVDCNWPSQWCTIGKGSGPGIPDIKCSDVPQKCQQMFAKPAPPVQKDSVLEDNQQISSSAPHSGAQMPSEAPHATGGSCIDRHKFCCYWAARGECEKNAFFMKLACQKSCGTCGCTLETVPTCAVNVNIGDCKFLSAMDQNQAPQPDYPPQPQPPQTQPSYKQAQPEYQRMAQPQSYQQPEQPTYQRPQVPSPCSQRPDCQVGIFPSAGGGCGAQQYGGRAGCGQETGYRPAPMLPKPSPSAGGYKQPSGMAPMPTGVASNPTLPVFDDRESGKSQGCGDMSNSCQTMKPSRCQNSQLIQNVVCPQACGQCQKRKKK